MSDTPSGAPKVSEPVVISPRPEKPEAPQKDRPLKEGVFLASAAVLSTMNWLTDDDFEPRDDLPEFGLKPGTYDSIGEVLPYLDFVPVSHTGEHLSELVKMYANIYSGEADMVYYHDGQGRVLGELPLPHNWHTLEKGEWHDEQRRGLGSPVLVLPGNSDRVGYPLVSVARAPETYLVEAGMSLVDLAVSRSNERTSYETVNLAYFDGQEIALVDAIEEICNVYDVPVELAMGLAGNESLFDKDADNGLSGKNRALGIFQFTKAGFKDAVENLKSNVPFRRGTITYSPDMSEAYWKNRFIQIELFCSYINLIKERLNRSVSGEQSGLNELEARLRVFDPSFKKEYLDDIAALNCFHTGTARIRRCISHFLSLSDIEIQQRLGRGPFGIDVWPAIMSNAVGQVDKVGRQSYEYTFRALGMAHAISESDGLYFDEYNRDVAINILSDEVVETGSQALAWTGAIGAILTSMGVVFHAGVNQVKVEMKADATKKQTGTRPDMTLSRRSFWKWTGAAAATAMLSGADDAAEFVADTMEGVFDGNQDSERSAFIQPDIEIPAEYASVYTSAQEKIRERYKVLDEADMILMGASERNLVNSNSTNQFARFKMMQPTWLAMLGAEDYGTLLNKKGKMPASMRDRFNAAQDTYIREGLAGGTLLRFPQEAEGWPIFAEQVGMESGTSNNGDMMIMNAEYFPILQMVVGLVNQQIELFNTDPSKYGIASFPQIPPISSIKVSGALRTLEHQGALNSRNSSSTRSVSDHLSGNAIDIGSMATSGGHMVTFAADMKDENGNIMIRAGEKLPNDGFGVRTREFLSIFIGRAFIALREPLAKKGSKLTVRYEKRQGKNWHITLQS